MSSPELSPLPNRANRRRSKSRGIWKTLLWLVILLLAAATLYAGYLYFYKFQSMLNGVGTDETVAPGKSANEKPLALLLLGLDNRPATGSMNTDVIMIAAVNPQRKSATVVSIPRDTFLKGAKGLRSNKANAFYANFYKENQQTARNNMKDLIGGYLGIPIDYSAIIDFKGFEDLVDAVDGVKINVDMDMRYNDSEDGTRINLRRGEQTLNGKQALDFVRYRKSNEGTAESSDLERNARQQQVVAQILKKLKSLGGIYYAGGVLDATRNNLKTDIPKSQITSLMRTYIGIDGDKIQYIHLDGEWRSPYIYVSSVELAKARTALQATLK